MAIYDAPESLHVGTGTETVFGFNWPYLLPRDLRVTVNGTEVPTVLASTNQVAIVPAPPALSIVRVFRNTPAQNPTYLFATGIPMLPKYIDGNNKQLLYALQEGLLAFSQAQATADEALVRAAAAEVSAAEAAASAAQQAINIRRTIRVPSTEAEIPALPPVSARAGKVLGFDSVGNPVGTLPATGSGTELALDLAEKDDPNKGAMLVGRSVVSIATLADLLAAPRDTSVTYRVASYHGGWSAALPYVGPLGGGDFKWQAASTVPADGGVIHQVPGVSVGRFVRMGHTNSVRPEWYGALGDGVQDDTIPMRMACRSIGVYETDYGYTFRKEGGRRIKLRAGANYRITQPVYLRKGDWLQGGGYTATRVFSNQAGIGQLIYVGWGLVDGVLVRDAGGLIPKVTDICFAETVGGVSAIFLDSISGWDVRDCWFFADVGVRTQGITNDGFMLNCVADNGSGHLAIFEGTGDGYHTGQSTTVDNCGAFRTRYGGIKLDGVSDVTIKGGFLNFVPFYGLYTGTVKKNSRVKAVGVNFKGTIDGVGMDTTQQHIRVTAPTDGFAIVDCGFAYSRNADIQANYPVQVRGGYSIGAAIDSIVCLGGRSSIEGTEFADTGRYPVRSTVRIDMDSLRMRNPLAIGIPADIFATGAIYLAGTASKSTAYNCKRYDDKGPAISTNGVSGMRTSGNVAEGAVDVLHYTGSGVNYSDNERANNPVGLWRNVELLRDGYTRWVDSSGRQRIKNGDPTSETDGVVVGTQV